MYERRRACFRHQASLPLARRAAGADGAPRLAAALPVASSFVHQQVVGCDARSAAARAAVLPREGLYLACG
jgi:hypothetical protein